MKIIDYDLVCSSSLDDFNDSIKEFIGYGWQPMGSCFVCDEVTNRTPSNREVYYYQTVVKYEAFSLSPGHIVSGPHIENAKLKGENEQLKYKLDGNSALIESLQKEITLLNERAQPRDDALLSHIESNEIYEKIIKDFISYYRRIEGEAWVMLNDDIFTCGTKSHGVECLFNKIITKYKMDRKNENNN